MHFHIMASGLKIWYSLEKFIGPPALVRFGIFTDFQRNVAGRRLKNTGNISAARGFLKMFCTTELKELLAAVVSHGKKIAIATSKPEVYTVQILKYFGIEHYFQFVAGSTLDGGRSKKGDVIRYALDSLKITADQAVMVGDRKHDVIGSKRKWNVQAVGVLYGYGDRKGTWKLLGQTVLSPMWKN